MADAEKKRQLHQIAKTIMQKYRETKSIGFPTNPTAEISAALWKAYKEGLADAGKVTEKPLESEKRPQKSNWRFDDE